jgi:hypothetical protein
MTTYLARLIADQQLVGIFTVRDDSELFWLVDECCDPGAVEITELGTGGVFWGTTIETRVPAPVDANGESDLLGLPDGSTISGGWSDAFFDYGRELGWRPVPHS